MPQRNTVKRYVAGGYYHVYNRGVEKRNIFLDDQDYRVFLHLLKYYLSPQDDSKIHPLANLESFTLIRPRPLANLEKEINLLAFCLMPNHFHLLIQQITQDGMSKLLRRLLTTYAMYFNRRYDRVGHLFQSIYKAVLVDKDEYLLHLSRYIHLNPVELTGLNLVSYPYSSYPYFLRRKRANWVKPDFILDYFESSKNKLSSYQKFIEGYIDEHARDFLGSLAID